MRKLGEAHAPARLERPASDQPSSPNHSITECWALLQSARKPTCGKDFFPGGGRKGAYQLWVVAPWRKGEDPQRQIGEKEQEEEERCVREHEMRAPGGEKREGNRRKS